AQGPHGVGFGLLLPGHGQHTAVASGLDVRGGHDRGGAADGAGGVHAQQRLAHGAQGVGHHQLGHHDALEQVGGLAHDHRVDVVPTHSGVGHGGVDRLAAQSGHRDVGAAGDVVGLPGAEDGGRQAGGVGVG